MGWCSRAGAIKKMSDTNLLSENSSSNPWRIEYSQESTRWEQQRQTSPADEKSSRGDLEGSIGTKQSSMKPTTIDPREEKERKVT